VKVIKKMIARQPLETMHPARRCHTHANPVAHKVPVVLPPFLVLVQLQHPFLMLLLLLLLKLLKLLLTSRLTPSLLRLLMTILTVSSTMLLP
jgi:hypothetical protein